LRERLLRTAALALDVLFLVGLGAALERVQLRLEVLLRDRARSLRRDLVLGAAMAALERVRARREGELRPARRARDVADQRLGGAGLRLGLHAPIAGPAAERRRRAARAPAPRSPGSTAPCPRATPGSRA